MPAAAVTGAGEAAVAAATAAAVLDAGVQPQSLRIKAPHAPQSRRKTAEVLFCIPSLWRDRSEECKDVVAHLLCYEQRERAVARELLNHRWFDMSSAPSSPSASFSV